MRGYRNGILVCTFCFLILLGSLNAQYWFQFGARGGGSTSFNNGAAVNIQTVTQQNLSSGSLGFWIGETLQNGAFIQVGYLIENLSGQYPSSCTPSGCSNYQEIKAGDAEWFYEYFPPNVDGGFYGAIGPDNSAGGNGTFNRYSFESNGTTWNFYLNGNNIGSVDLGTDNSGSNSPVVFGEVANTSSASTYLKLVTFYNASIFKNGTFAPFPSAYSYIGYGVGSLTRLGDPYGIEEVGNKIDYFSVGSGIPQQPNGNQLWNLGYELRISSQYGNLSKESQYIAYSNVKISAPSFIYINNFTRVAFDGWTGSGDGSYTGPSNNSTLMMNGNITEAANWQLQYFVNVSSIYSISKGTGWYDVDDIVNYSINSSYFYKNSSSRLSFQGWSTGGNAESEKLIVTHPTNVTAIWIRQFLVNATAQYGSVSGEGWYDNDSLATISLNFSPINTSANERIAFYGWSDNESNSSTELFVSSPIVLYARFMNQYLANIRGSNVYGGEINAQSFYINDKSVGSKTYLFSGINYTVTGVNYNGANISLDYNINVDSPATVYVPLPLYNAQILTRDVFGIPVNALTVINFDNGTTSVESSGSNGDIVLENVPYGEVNATVTYMGLAENVQTDNGVPTKATFVSILDYCAFALVIAISLIIHSIMGRRHMKHFKAKKLKRMFGEGQ